MLTQPGEDLSFFSVSLDGRISQWLVHAATLKHTDVLDFNIVDQLTTKLPTHDKTHLKGNDSGSDLNYVLLNYLL